VTELVVQAALLPIREHLVRLLHLAKPLRRAGTLVLVGMELLRQLAVRALDLVRGGRARHTEHLVEVPGHGEP